MEPTSSPPSRRCCVVIPTHNEAQHLSPLLGRVFAEAAQVPDHELWAVVVDDDSLDDSDRVLEQLQREFPRLRVLRGAKRGLGMAYQRGFSFALETLQADLLVQMDGDLQHDPAVLPLLIGCCRSEVGAVIGSRFAPGGSTPSFSRRRRGISIVGNWLIRRLTGLPHLYDYTSGYRCLNASLAAQCMAACARNGLATRGFAFQSSLIAELLLTRAPVLELPITFGQREHGHSKLTRRDYWEFVLNLRRLRRRCRRTRSADQRPAQ